MDSKTKQFVSFCLVLCVGLGALGGTAQAGGATKGEQNALRKAQTYLSFQAFSRKGLVEQLKFEGFTPAQAQYGAAKVRANWSAQAAKKAKSYLETQSFSRKGLIEQLKFDGFTTGQATYGVNASHANWNAQAAKK